MRLGHELVHCNILDLSVSGALVTAMLDWAKGRGIGFSQVVSLGEHADIDFGDMLDYLASDARTRAILLYIESVTSARKFMSAARAAARNKPVIVVKSGRSAQGQKAAASHTGALAGSDRPLLIASGLAGLTGGNLAVLVGGFTIADPAVVLYNGDKRVGEWMRAISSSDQPSRIACATCSSRLGGVMKSEIRCPTISSRS